MAAFALEPLGPPAPCGFPGCVLAAYHDGDHQLKKAESRTSQHVYTCGECGTRFVIYGEVVAVEKRTCGSQACILSAASREVFSIPLGCRCAQLPYPHDVTEHKAIRYLSAPKRWPWTLRLAPEMTLNHEQASPRVGTPKPHAQRDEA